MKRIQVAYGRVDPNTTKARTYVYGTTEPVTVGDVVLVPPNWLVSRVQEATVVSLDTDYDGPTDRILRVVERAA